jgi:conjugative transfer ATPase
VTAIYRPRLFVVEAGNSFGLFGDFAARLGLSVHRVKLAPGSGVTLAPFADARRLVETPGKVWTLDAEALNEDRDGKEGGNAKDDGDEQRDVRDALRHRADDASLPDIRRARLQEMADAMDIFTQGADGEMFDRPGSPWPEADVTIVDLATYAREGYNAQLSIAYIGLINTVNNLAERDQYLGRPIVNVTDEGHIITKNPLLAPYVVKVTKMWRKLGAWYWLATQNIDDLPKAAEPMLNMTEWWICLSMPLDEVEKIARFRELSPARRALMPSARKESGKFTEGVILSRNMELLFRAVPPSLYLALAQTEPEEKAERYRVMKEFGVGELDAAIRVAGRIDKARGIETLI